MNLLSQENTAEGIHSCSNCGAQVIIPAGEAMGHCEFCGGQFVRRAFATSDELPEVIIPFVLTEEEARDRLKEWAMENKKENEARTVLSTIQKLSGYYLPYELIRGPVTAEAERMETYSDRKYHCGGFLNGIAVNQFIPDVHVPGNCRSDNDTGLTLESLLQKARNLSAIHRESLNHISGRSPVLPVYLW